MTDLALHVRRKATGTWRAAFLVRTCCELAERLTRSLASTSSTLPMSPETLACLATRSEAGLQLWVAARRRDRSS